MQNPQRAKIHLTGAQIHYYLELPDSLRVVGFVGKCDPVSMDILVEGDHLAPVEDDSEAPYLTVRSEVRVS